MKDYEIKMKYCIELYCLQGVWDGYDHWAGKGGWQSVVSLTLGLSSLSLARALKTGWSMPVNIWDNFSDSKPLIF